jgi:hypothetical protein
LRRDVQVFVAVPSLPAQAGESKNIILTRAAELAPPEGVAGRQERDAEGAAPDAFFRVTQPLRGLGANWGNLLGGAERKFPVGAKNAKRYSSLRSNDELAAWDDEFRLETNLQYKRRNGDRSVELEQEISG